jgi:hypothetical protein
MMVFSSGLAQMEKIYRAGQIPRTKKKRIAYSSVAIYRTGDHRTGWPRCRTRCARSKVRRTPDSAMAGGWWTSGSVVTDCVSIGPVAPD